MRTRRLIQRKGIESQTRRFLPNMFSHLLLSNELSYHTICNRLASRLDSVDFVNVTSRVILTINTTESHCKLIRVHFSKLGNVLGIVSLFIFHGFFTNFIKIIPESFEILDNQVVGQCPLNQIGFHLFEVKELLGSDLFGALGVQELQGLFDESIMESKVLEGLSKVSSGKITFLVSVKVLEEVGQLSISLVDGFNVRHDCL
mmetsp:Transcript_17509/g.27384  ORF Transcript_17509/g.27384 Transcript_17509/m.27384 type:complete len:202 (-) Transcript_17509:106-711(-)